MDIRVDFKIDDFSRMGGRDRERPEDGLASLNDITILSDTHDSCKTNQSSLRLLAATSVLPVSKLTGDSLLKSAASSLVPGPSSAALFSQMEALSRNNVRFFKKRSFYIPRLMNEKKEISHEQAAKILTSGNEKDKRRLQALVDFETLILELKEEDVRELTAFKELDSSIQLPQKELADFLKSTESNTMAIRSEDGEVKGAYGAYRYLISGSNSNAPLQIAFNNVPLMAIIPDDCRNVNKLTMELQDWKNIIKRLGGSAEIVSVVREPLNNVSINDRIDIAAEILERAQKRDSYYWHENTTKEYRHIAEKSGGGPCFVELSKLYLKMVDSETKYQNSEDQLKGLDLIHSRLKDHPGEFQYFTDLLGKGFSIAPAVKIFEMLPQPVNQGDYEKAAGLFTDPTFWDEERVELVMKPVSAGSLEGRIGALKAIFAHARQYYESSQWESTRKAYESLLDKSGDGFESMGKMFVQMLDARGKDSWEEAYLKGLELIDTRFKDHGDEFACYLDLLKRGFDISTAVKIFESLPQPVSQGDYEKAAAHFHQDPGCWNEERVELVMKPAGTSSLRERIYLLKEIYGKQRAYHDSDKWEYAKRSYSTFLEKAGESPDFSKIGKLYVDMIEADKDGYSKESHEKGIELIAASLKDNRDDLATFFDLLKREFTVSAAAKIYTALPQPVGEGDFGKMACTFREGKFWDEERVEFVMTRYPEMPVQDRINFVLGIEPHEEGSEHRDRWKNTVSDIKFVRGLSRDDADFVELSKLYTGMLEAGNSRSWLKEYRKGMSFLVEQRSERPDRYQSFITILGETEDVKSAMKIYSLIQEPVKGEDYFMRVRVAEALGGLGGFPEKYELLRRNILPGETIEDAALLLAAVSRLFSADGLKECEKYLRELYALKGDINSAEIADIVNIFYAYNRQRFPETLELLKTSVRGETFRVRKDIFVAHYKNRYGSNEHLFQDVIDDYGTIMKGLQPEDSLETGAGRFSRLWESIEKTGLDNANKIGEHSRDVYQLFCDGLREGKFEGRSFDDLLMEFNEELLFTKDIKLAKERLMHKYEQSGGGAAVIEREEEIIIGGIKLEKTLYSRA